MSTPQSAPLLEALSEDHDHALLSYLRAFRYPLAGEFAGHRRPGAPVASTAGLGTRNRLSR
ncbi:MAG: hypothetical protein U5K37_02440 [Natrialbaceae archaeon]|nr:hypothetical protein [Natrialbaceae archaeon]